MRQEVIQKAPERAKKQTPNLTGIPTQMKLDFERRSGLSFDDVRVHYNSDKPRKIGALAYTQIPQVHIGPGQERHLRHELGHVVQQKTSVVPITDITHNISINDSEFLEKQADLWRVNVSNLNPYKYSAIVQCQKPDIDKDLNDEDDTLDEGESLDYDEDAETDTIESIPLFEKDSRKKDKLSKESKRLRHIRIQDEVVVNKHQKSPCIRFRRWPYLITSADIVKRIASLNLVSDLLLRDVEVLNETIEHGIKSRITVIDKGNYTIITTKDLFTALTKYRNTLGAEINYANPYFLAAILISLEKVHCGIVLWRFILTHIYYYQSHYKSFSDLVFRKLSTVTNSAETIGGWHLYHDAETKLDYIRPDWSKLVLNREKIEKKYRARFVGVHYTSVEKAVKLHQKHPDVSMVGKVNGLGRGEGFYYVPMKNLLNQRRKKSKWGEIAMAVFVSATEDVPERVPFGGADKIDGSNRIKVFSDDEAVIPTPLFNKTFLFSCFSEIAGLSERSAKTEYSSLYKIVR